VDISQRRQKHSVMKQSYLEVLVVAPPARRRLLLYLKAHAL